MTIGFVIVGIIVFFFVIRHELKVWRMTSNASSPVKKAQKKDLTDEGQYPRGTKL